MHPNNVGIYRKFFQNIFLNDSNREMTPKIPQFGSSPVF